MRRLIALAVISAGCASSLPDPVSLLDRAPTPEAVHKAAEDFYAATTPAQMSQAVEAARAAAPDDPVTHELAGRLALFHNDSAAAFDHWYEAVRVPTYDGALTTLAMLRASVSWLRDEDRRMVALCRRLATDHPNPAVRARCARAMVAEVTTRFFGEGIGAWRPLLTGTLPLWLVGTWDNDQGKGFDAVYPPEARGATDQTTYGTDTGDLRWRRSPARNANEQYPMTSLFSPDEWSVMYGAATVKLPKDGQYAIHVSSGEPFKLWLDGRLLASFRRVKGYEPDAFRLPLRLRAGSHTLLIKYAELKAGGQLGLRLTAADGKAIEGLEHLPLALRPAAATKAILVDAARALVSAGPATTSARGAALRLGWVSETLAGTYAIEAAEAGLKRWPGSLVFRYGAAGANWDAGERGRASDLLAALDKDVGAELPMVAVKRARFLRQGKRYEKARKRLERLTAARPNDVVARAELALVFKDEGWNEDRCSAWRQVLERYPRYRYGLEELARCQSATRRFADRTQTLKKILAHYPDNRRMAGWMISALRNRGEHQAAVELAKTEARRHPYGPGPLLKLAENQRLAGDFAEARRTLRKAEKLDPDKPQLRVELGRLEYEAGNKEAAVVAWRRAIELGSLAKWLPGRIAWLAGEDSEPWLADVPSDAQLKKAVSRREGLKPSEGAVWAYLLDHGVCRARPDGSRTCVTTEVSHAFNTTGRDRLTKVALPPGARRRILHAYAVLPDGKVAEASSIRGREIRFRGLTVGSTTVVQVRTELRPPSYLRQHFTANWWFEGPQRSTLLSEWILWLPASNTLHTSVRGKIAHTERKEGDLIRHAWRAENRVALIGERATPSALLLADHISVSTVPDWATFVAWERELLHDALRSNDAVEAVATRILAGAQTAQEKVYRIHRHVMQEIRYQQDYEDTIAGVKPHSAPQVVERAYGDCKDKTVLFIMLARQAGLEAQFALIRTRPKGPVRKELPMQQFNHAIVYVPKQEGIPTGRFYDPTADLLDLSVVRSDDQGTLSLVYAPESQAYRWIRVPYGKPEDSQSLFDMDLTLDKSGALRGRVTWSAVGSTGSALRRLARNPQQVDQLAQRVLANILPNATVKNAGLKHTSDLTRAVEWSFQVEWPHRVRDGRVEVRLRFPAGLRAGLSATERRHPLVLGVPSRTRIDARITLPSGARVEKRPTDYDEKARCLSWTRKVTEKAKGKVRTAVFGLAFRSRCERFPAAEYAVHRKASMEVGTLDEEPLTVRLPK